MKAQKIKRHNTMQRNSLTRSVSLTLFAVVGILLAVTNEVVAREPEYRPARGSMTAAMADATWTDASRDREVPVRIYAPDLKHGSGSFPTVVFSHGGGESREAFGYLGHALAENGFVVVFLTHKGSDREALRKDGLRALGASAFEQRPEDVRFAFDRLVSDDLEEELLKGRVDPDRLAVAGQCAGATTALAVAGLTTKRSDGTPRSYRDPRPKAVVALSPQPGASSPRRQKESLHEDSWKTVSIPALVITGTNDFQWMRAVRENPDVVRRPYTGMPQGERYLVDIVSAEHHAFTDSKPYYPGGPRDPRHHDWIGQATIAFLDAYLNDNEAARDWLRNKRLQTATDEECRQEDKLNCQGGADSEASATANRDFKTVDEFLQASLPRMDGGCALILIAGDRVIYRKAFGSFTAETVVPIASASKWISGGVIMALIDDGTIRLDDRASKFLPQFQGKKGDITIRQMFTHTHGFPERPTHHRNTRVTLEEAVDRIAEVPLACDPGTELLYSGLGMQVAARIAEIATGKSWVEIFEEKIGGPLEMESTTYYAFGRTDNPNVAGSIETCIDDYGHFVTTVLNRGVFRGKRVLSEEAVAAMLTNQCGDVPIRRHPWQGYTDFAPHMADTPYGIGCWLEEVDPKSGKVERASSGGAFGCQPFVDLKRNVAGVLLPYARTMKRSSTGHPYNDASVVYLELREILNAILDGKPAAKDVTSTATPSQPTPQSDPSEHAEALERLFRFADRNGDGGLSLEELPERMRMLRRAFDRLDRDGDGKLSREELTGGMRALQKQSPRGNRPRTNDHNSRSRPPVDRSGNLNGGQLYRSQQGPHAVDSEDLVLLRDNERQRNLQVRVTYPKAEGPFPVILMSHYVGGARHDYRPLVDHWVSHGYVCIQADHSDSRELGDPRGKRLDFRARAQDLSFLIDSLPQIEGELPAAGGKIDTDRIGAGGHLIGAYASCLLVGMKVFTSGDYGQPETFEDDRVDAALLLSPQGRGQGLTDRSWEDVDRPMLVMAGSDTPSRRTGNPPEWRTEPFEFARPGDKYLIVIDGLDNRYAGLIDGQRPTEPLACWIKSSTLAFWDAHLKAAEDAREFLNSQELEQASGGDAKVRVKHNEKG